MFRCVPQLTVKSIPKSIEFYRDRLGMKVTMSDPPDSPDFASLEREDFTLFLVSEGSREESGQIRDLKMNKRGVGVRIYIEVDDARVIHDKLVAAGVAIARAIEYNAAEKYTEFSIVDPDGYAIGIYS